MYKYLIFCTEQEEPLTIESDLATLHLSVYLSAWDLARKNSLSITAIVQEASIDDIDEYIYNEDSNQLDREESYIIEHDCA